MDTAAGSRVKTRPGFPTVSLAEITRPGVYVTPRGDMLRVASEFMAGGPSPILAWGGLCQVTLLSDDPCEPVSEIRQRAAKAALRFNF